MLELLSDPQVWVGLLTLTALELVLGIDNIVFISILAGKLPAEQQERARRVGLALAMIMRIVLLFFLSWMIHLEADLFTVWGHGFSGRDLILIIGGLFLLAKSTLEIHHKLEGEGAGRSAAAQVTFSAVIVQILLLDVVFSIDSVVTAVGMVEHIEVMIVAVVIAVLCMMKFAGPIGRFVEARPTVKMLALSFLLLIGVALVADGLDFHIPKGYVYFAMGFSVFVELLNLKIRGRGKPVELHTRYESPAGDEGTQA